MSTWAHLNNGVVTNVSVGDAAWGQEQGLVLLDSITPTPGVGWTLSGSTWTAPAPVADPAAAQRRAAAATTTTLLSGVPARIAQAHADLATLAGITDPATGIPSAAVQAILVRIIESLLVMTDGVQAIVAAQ